MRLPGLASPIGATWARVPVTMLPALECGPPVPLGISGATFSATLALAARQGRLTVLLRVGPTSKRRFTVPFGIASITLHVKPSTPSHDTPTPLSHTSGSSRTLGAHQPRSGQHSRQAEPSYANIVHAWLAHAEYRTSRTLASCGPFSQPCGANWHHSCCRVAPERRLCCGRSLAGCAYVVKYYQPA